MQPFAAIAAAAALAMLPSSGGPGPEPEIGKPAPAFTLIDANGQKHSLSDYKGKTVVIEWVNITCPNAQANYQSGVIPRLQKKYAGKDVVWLSMIITQKQQDEYGQNLISEERAKAMANDMVQTYGASPTATLIDVDGTVGTAYGTRTSMHLFVVDPKGTLVYDGALDDQSGEESGNYVAAAVDETLAGKPVTTSKTMPYGCHPVGDHLMDGGAADSTDAGE